MNWETNLLILQDNGFYQYNTNEFVKRVQCRFGDTYFEYSIAIYKLDVIKEVNLNKKLENLSGKLDWQINQRIIKYANSDNGIIDQAKEIARITKFDYVELANVITCFRKNRVSNDKIKDFILKMDKDWTVYEGDLNKIVNTLLSPYDNPLRIYQILEREAVL